VLVLLESPRRELVLLLAVFLVQPVSAAEDPAADEKARELVASLLAASSDERPGFVERLIALGPDALATIEDARKHASDGSVLGALERAATWIAAGRVTEVLERGIETQLTFDGQYAELRADAAKNVPALLALIDDESTDFAVRVAACRALADVAEPAVVPFLRELYSDLLVPPALREEIGVVLAIFGDGFAVRKELKEYSRGAKSRRIRERLSAHIELANLNYRIRKYRSAVESYEEILRLTKELYDARRRSGLPKALLAPIEAQLSLHYYNAACSNTLFGDLERAKDYLRKAVAGNPEHFSNIEKDGDLLKLRQHPSYPEFRRELGKLFENQEL
jgi:tetratricopeptide (TPR) repeat protein